jgi:hypothetical protein
MGNKINFNTSGPGSVSIGGIVQGDGNRVGNMVSIVEIDAAISRAQAKVAQLAPPGPKRADEGAKVAEHLQTLGAEAKQPNPSEEKGTAILKVIRENFSWAYPVVQDLARAIWPALLSLV